MTILNTTIEQNLYIDPQAQAPAGYCEICGGELYAPSMLCSRCQRRSFLPLKELSKGYRHAAQPLRQRLHRLRKELETAEDPEQIWHIKRRIAELTPMLTQMNELADLTEHYYDRGYWRSEKYTL
jgi:uncharacterized membrane protein YccC